MGWLSHAGRLPLPPDDRGSALTKGRLLFVVALQFCLSGLAVGQELQPRAYLPVPAGMGFVGFSYSHNSGGFLFDPSLPVEDSDVRSHVPSVSVGYCPGLLGRSTQMLAVFPYIFAGLYGRVAGVEGYRYRSGLTDSVFRFAINLHGAPAMSPKEFATYRQKTIVGASFTAYAPLGQYDPNVLANIGSNRWAFKPEVGISRPYRMWVFEAAAGIWLFTKNAEYFRGSVRSQDPLGGIQAHIVRLLPHRTWFAFDATAYTGGRSYLNGKPKADYQGNTRIGFTYGIALSRRQALRFTYFQGATTRVGVDLRSVSVAYQIAFFPGLRRAATAERKSKSTPNRQ